MFHRIFRCKLHRVTVTQGDVNYRGSVTIDEELLRKIGLMPLEEVDIWDITNGERLRTYVIPGPPGSRIICINGAAAHRIRKNDLIIIAAYGYMSSEELAKGHTAKVIVGSEDAGKHPNDILQYNEIHLKAGDYHNWEYFMTENADKAGY